MTVCGTMNCVIASSKYIDSISVLYLSCFICYKLLQLLKYTHIFSVYTVTWSMTERREIRNFYYPSVFELAGRQRLTIEREIRNVGQLRPAVEGRKECGSVPRGRSNKSRSEWKPTDVCIRWPERRRKRLNDWPEP